MVVIVTSHAIQMPSSRLGMCAQCWKTYGQRNEATMSGNACVSSDFFRQVSHVLASEAMQKPPRSGQRQKLVCSNNLAIPFQPRLL